MSDMARGKFRAYKHVVHCSNSKMFRPQLGLLQFFSSCTKQNMNNVLLCTNEEDPSGAKTPWPQQPHHAHAPQGAHQAYGAKETQLRGAHLAGITGVGIDVPCFTSPMGI